MLMELVMFKVHNQLVLVMVTFGMILVVEPLAILHQQRRCVRAGQDDARGTPTRVAPDLLDLLLKEELPPKNLVAKRRAPLPTQLGCQHEKEGHDASEEALVAGQRLVERARGALGPVLGGYTTAGAAGGRAS